MGDDLYSDCSSRVTTLGPQPLTLLRAELTARRLKSSAELKELGHGQPAWIAGLVVGRQRCNETFATLEDEYGMVNVAVSLTPAT